MLHAGSFPEDHAVPELPPHADAGRILTGLSVMVTIPQTRLVFVGLVNSMAYRVPAASKPAMYSPLSTSGDSM
jgi:hypothetical protein